MKREGDPTMLVYYLFYPRGHERRSLAKNDMHLTWTLSDNIVIVLSFDCHGRVLSEML